MSLFDAGTAKVRIAGRNKRNSLSMVFSVRNMGSRGCVCVFRFGGKTSRRLFSAVGKRRTLFVNVSLSGRHIDFRAGRYVLLSKQFVAHVRQSRTRATNKCAIVEVNS